MEKEKYMAIEAFMLNQAKDSAHDKHHIYRVLNAAVDIAKYENSVDMDILITACLLHDIGRSAQAENPKLCHAKVGAEMAYAFLLEQGWQQEKALHVRDCVSSHRYRGDNLPASIEAKILFDADKLDVSGAVGIARTLIYAGQVCCPLYITGEDGNIVVDRGDSFFREYNYKLKNIYDSFYTARAKEIASTRKKVVEDFYNGLLAEVTENYKNGFKTR